jgi:hypothetical protein
MLTSAMNVSVMAAMADAQRRIGWGIMRTLLRLRVWQTNLTAGNRQKWA